ncbi:MAG: S-layer homology domain-containing protein [Clostridia bacterium]|nr:S-layer homology domain-containing protein [Clostridia bacterium]
MKKTLPVFFAVMLVLFSVVSAAASLSPAIEILSKNLEMKRCITQKGVVSFDENTFDEYFGQDTDSVTVSSIPPITQGMLSCMGFELEQGQTVTRDSFALVSFIPAGDFNGVSKFSFSNGENVLTCSVLVSENQNMPPQTGAQTVDTQKNITVFKSFSAADPENDTLEYEIVKYPRHGSVYVNHTGGQFVYTPDKNYMGEDYFTYKAVDFFGNTSQEQRVEIKVSKPAADVYFSDMENHWAHNSAIKMAATGLMSGEETENGVLFCPDEDMSRGDFLALSLITAGHESEIPFVEKTVFADDSLIPDNIKSYAQYAYDKGIINGYPNGDGSVNFESACSITRAQAAVITSKILGLTQDEATDYEASYTDAAAIPSWASSQINSLTVCGIIKGEPSGQVNAEKVLSRAEGAEMICNVANYLEDKEKKERPKKKTIFNLFGLLD